MSAFSLSLMTLPQNARGITLFVGGTGPDNYTTIQSAINDANPGDIVYVYNGTYVERLTIGETISLVGEDRDTTLIIYSALGEIVSVSADWVNITGFSIRNTFDSGVAIDLGDSNYCYIANSNISSKSTIGLLSGGSHNVIADNIIAGGGYGIAMIGYYNVIVNNYVTSNGVAGIGLMYADYTIIANNTISGNKMGISMCANNTVIDNNTFSEYTEGIDFHGYYNVITNNTFVGKIDGNGIRNPIANFTTITNNTFLGHRWALEFWITTDNMIHHNNFVNNSIHAVINRSNDDWDNGYPSGGNYWDDYSGSDQFSGPNQDQPGSDGIGDTPYDLYDYWGPVLKDQDLYPLTTPVPSRPSPPRNLQATAGNQEVDLTWTAPLFDGGSPITDYTVYRGTAPQGEEFLVKIGNVTEYDDTGLTNGQTYYYKVSALNSIGEGPKSNEAHATPTAGQTIPSEPQNLEATPGDSYVNLTWIAPISDGNSTITNYRVYRGAISGGESFLIELGNVTAHTDISLTNGQRYYYQVSAVNGVGEGLLSNEASATPTAVPGAPTALKASLDGNGLENVIIAWSLSLDDGAGQNSVVGYKILRNTTYNANGEGYLNITFVPNGMSEFVDHLAGEGDPSNYFYRVCVVGLNNKTNCSIDQVAKFTRTLSPGLNIVSIPLIQANESITTILQTAKWDKAWAYDSIRQEWASYVKSKLYLGDLSGVNHTMGFWVNVAEESNLTVAGIVPAQTLVRLRAGWNLIGFPSLNSTYAVGDLKAETGAMRAEGFDASTSPYFLKFLADGEILQAGYGYWVWVDGDSTWTVENS